MYRNVCQKLLAICIAFISIFSVELHAQLPDQRISLQTIPRLENTLIWQVSGNGLTKPSFIFGTMHAICVEDYVWTSAMDSAFNHAELLVLEVDLGDVSAFQDSIMSFFLSGLDSLDFNEDSTEMYTVDKVSDSSLAAYIVSDTIEVGINDEMEHEQEAPFWIENLMPKVTIDSAEEWVTYQSDYYEAIDTSNQSILNNDFLECASQKSYELELSALAKERKKSIKGLESIYEQLAIIYGNFDEISEKPNVEASSIEIVNNIAVLYKQQKLDEMYVYAMQFMGNDKQTYELIDGRNIKWVEKIPDLLKAQSCFIAVGAAHLSGNNGIIHLLRKKGYTVTPIFNTN